MVQPIRPLVQGARPLGKAPGLPRLEVIERKSEVLKASSLGCLGRPYDATINLTQGGQQLALFRVKFGETLLNNGNRSKGPCRNNYAVAVRPVGTL